jgi:hypothetical protein
LFDHPRHEKVLAVRIRRVAQHRVGILAVIHHVGALFHRHRRHRGHGLDALDIDLLQLLHERQNGIDLATQVLDFVVRNRDPRQMRDTANGCSVDFVGHFRPLSPAGHEPSLKPRIADAGIPRQLPFRPQKRAQHQSGDSRRPVQPGALDQRPLARQYPCDFVPSLLQEND